MRIENIGYGAWSAVINLSRGANCISLRNKEYGAKLLREPDAFGELDNPYLYGMPILFPVNRIEGGKFEFEGREYVFPINEVNTGCHLHGELHRTEFEVLAKSESKIKCRYIADRNNRYLSFPHELEIIMEYELKNDGFYQTVTVQNLSDKNMPVFLGFHTTFNTLFANGCKSDNIRVLAEISEEYERLMGVNYLPTGKKLEFDSESSALNRGEYKPFRATLSRHYRASREGRMAICDIEKGLRVVYENDEKFGFRLIYNGGTEGYICLEPQTCLANCQNSPFLREEAGFDYIKAGGARSYRSRIYLEEF